MKKEKQNQKENETFPLEALGKTVLIEVIEQDEFDNMKGTVILLKKELGTNIPKGRIVSIGKTWDNPDNLQIGDIVGYRGGAGDSISYNRKAYWCMSYLDISVRFPRIAGETIKIKATDVPRIIPGADVV